MGDPKLHCKLSLSSAERWMACPGSVYLSSKCPAKPSSKYAEEGTRAHGVLENILTDVLINNGNLLKSFNKHKEGCDNEEMENHVLNAALEITKICLNSRLQRIGVERKFLLHRLLDIGGTADVCFVCTSPAGKRVGVVVDFKYGQGKPVEVDGNRQLLGYACSIDQDPEWGPIDRAVVYIYQPRCEHPDGPLRFMKVSREELDKAYKHFCDAGAKAVNQERNQEPQYSAGDHCMWCPAQAVCMAYAKHMRGETGMDFLPEISQPIILPDPTVLNDEQLRRLVLSRKDIEAYLKRIEEFVMAEALAGDVPAGLKLVRGKGAGRKWADPDPEITALALRSRGVAEPYNYKLKGITEVEAEIGKEKIDDLTMKPEAPLKIVSIDDKREAVLTTAEQSVLDFNN